MNDGSPDTTQNVLRALVKKDKHVVAITHSRNFGSQMAFISRMNVARGDAVVVLDGDLQDPPELIPQFYALWQKGYEVVYGIRTKREESYLMQLAYKLFYRIFRMLSYVRVPLDAGDFSLMDKKVVKHILSFPERDLFLRGIRAWVGFRQTGIAYVRPARKFGTTTNNLFKNTAWAMKGIVSFSYIPLELISWVALITFFISFIGICIQIVLRILLPHTPQGITMILVVVLFIGSVQLLAVGIIGQYIAKIFEEVKQRPKYIVTQVLRHTRRV